MKSYTDLEQSKRLAEILPIKSADMKWYFWKSEIDAPKLPTFGYNKKAAETCKSTEVVYLPCWSLAALLNLLPSKITYFETTYKIQIRKYTLTKGVDVHQIAYGNIKFDVDGQYSFKDMINTGEKENLIDACVQMIINLKELNILYV